MLRLNISSKWKRLVQTGLFLFPFILCAVIRYIFKIQTNYIGQGGNKMKTNKLSYEEQVLKIGNGKMLEPGFYNVDLEKVEDINNGFLKSRTPNKKTDSIRYAIFEKDDTSIRSEKCYNLRNMCAVVLPQNLKTIEEEAFSFCFNLKEIVFPDGLEKIGEDAFLMSGLQSVTIPASVKMIRESAFRVCENLVSFTIEENEKPGFVIYLGSRMFEDCSKLRDLSLSNCVLHIPNGFCQKCNSLTNVDLPESVLTIDAWAFGRCHNLETVKIEANIEYINNCAFALSENFDIEYCGIKTSINDLGSESFCDRLKWVHELITKSETAINSKKIEEIKSLLKCHDDYSLDTTQINYELVKAIRVILGIDERNEA